jgi:hypothetical protein
VRNALSFGGGGGGGRGGGGGSSSKSNLCNYSLSVGLTQTTESRKRVISE